MSTQQWKWKNIPNKEDPSFLEAPQRILQIYGPPGCGKSSAVFGWVRLVCETCRTQAYWVSCAAEAERCWFVRGAAGVGKVEIRTCAPPQTAEDVLGTPIVVFDGIRKSTIEYWRGLMNEMARAGIAVIVVSSEGVRFHEGDSQDIMKLQHFVPSWTLQEYVAACSNDDFWGRYFEVFYGGTGDDDMHRRQQLIETKFVVAGHSARYMFRSVEELIKQRIVQDAKSMGGIDSLESAIRDTRSAGAVNSIVARLQADKNGVTPQPANIPVIADLERAGVNRADFRLVQQEVDNENPEPCLVSAFAADEVAKNIPTSVERLRAVARALSNRAIEVYAFEQQLKKSLQEAVHPGQSLVLEEQNGQRVQLQVDRFISCDKSELESTLRNNVTPNTWIFVAGQQGAFDAIHVQSPTHLRFVQATVGQKHSFYLDIIDLLLQSLADTNIWTHVEFLVLRPSNERRLQFALDPARGKLQSFLRFDEQQWDQKDYRRNVTYKFLGWTEG